MRGVSVSNKPVEVFVMGGGMTALPGTLLHNDDDVARLQLGGVAEGQSVFFQPDSPGPWVFGRVAEVDGDEVEVAIQGHHRPDRREFARAWGPVHVRYQAVDSSSYELAGRRWLQMGQGVERKWYQPELFMNFSGSGLRFDGGEGIATGDMVLVGCRVPGDEREHRFTASVIRVASDEEGGSALHFLEATEGARMALVHFAERIQEQALDELGDLDLDL
jgi:hypothetical protein